jgi:flagellar motility protein MotE (MotC chaperone)
MNKFLIFMARFKIMPLLVVVAALSFGVRFAEFTTGISSAPKSAQAQQMEEAPQENIEVAQNNLDVPPPVPAAPVVSAEGQTGDIDKPSMEGSEEIDWRDAADTDLEFSEVRMELFQDLVDRRKKLEERERELSVREALLKAAEQELSQKYEELVSLRTEIKDLLVVQSEEEQKRTASLVKIYEGMKPKDAARIFNTLDLDVLLDVVARMSERKSAPILASMEPERARTVTIMLMEQKSLPTLSDDLLAN